MILQKIKKIQIILDNFNNPKNKEIYIEVYMIVKPMENYKKDKQKSANQLKEEISMI